jgi:hypothetical protein
MLILPRIASLNISSWIQYLAYFGGFLLGIEFLGKQRVDAADSILSTNADYIDRRFTAFFLYYFLIKVDDTKDRREIGAWYIFCVLDTLLLILLFSYTLPLLGVNAISWLKTYMTSGRLWALIIAIMILPFLSLFISRKVDSITKRITGNEIRSGIVILNVVSIPLFIIGGPITLPWLLFVALTWAIFKVLLFIVQMKARMKLGNVFLVFGIILLASSFVLFLIEQMINPSS